jgi:hypothetical protein
MRRLVLASLVLAAVLAAPPAFADRAAELRRVEDQSTVNLVTTGRKSGQPRTVTIWFVHALEGLTLDGKARPIEDAAESERIHQLFRDKYLTARVMSWIGAGGFGTGKVVAIDLE